MKYTVQRLLELKEKEGNIKGPAISDKAGFLLQARELDQQLHDLLMDIHEKDPSLFPPYVASIEDILEYY